MGTAELKKSPWLVDLRRFRVYLETKYHVETAYYYLGYVIEDNNDIYEQIQRAGFTLMFREHNSAMLGKKKGNVDSDIIFHVMKKLYTKEEFDNIILVSGDGDYKQLVDFLIQEKRLEKILFPNRKFASSLYKKLGSECFDYLDKEDIKSKIAKKKKKAP